MRNQSDSVALRNEHLVSKIKDIKAEHPFWGYRRVWAYLRYVDGVVVNKKRVYRLMKENNLTVKPNKRLIAKRVSERPKPRPERPKEWWGIDMTKVMTESGWVYVVIVLDWYTKKVVGHYSGTRATRGLFNRCVKIIQAAFLSLLFLSSTITPSTNLFPE